MRGLSIATNAYSDFLDLLPEELPGSGIAVISDNGETFESIVKKRAATMVGRPNAQPESTTAMDGEAALVDPAEGKHNAPLA